MYVIKQCPCNILTIQLRVRGLLARNEASRLLSILSAHAVPLPLYPRNQSDMADRLEYGPQDLDWFFESSEFYEWYRQDSTFLWLSGIKDSGKTVLTLRLRSYLRAKQTYNQTIDIATCFCPSSDTRRAPEAQVIQILSTLTRQILGEDDVRLESVTRDCQFPEPCHRLVPSLVPTTIDCLWRIFSKAVRVKQRSPTVILIDGVDKIQPLQERQMFLRNLLQLRHEVQSAGVTGFKIFVTSNPFEDIKKELAGTDEVLVIERHREEQRKLQPRMKMWNRPRLPLT